MKVAFHFLCSLKGTTGIYNLDAQEIIFNLIIRNKCHVRTKWYSGDILIQRLGCDVEQTKDGWTETFNKEKYVRICEAWIFAAQKGWCRIEAERLANAIETDFYAVCAETIEESVAELLNAELNKNPAYIGAFEIDDTAKIHWELYSRSLICCYRMNGNALNVFWDGMSEDSKDYSVLQHWKDFGFSNVEFEPLNGKGSIFDAYSNYEHAERLARWRKHASDMLASVADSVVFHLGDTAPELGKKLWASLSAFNSAETAEEYAHVALSCRRIVEYVADEVFPPTEEIKISSRKLGKKQFKNRLLAFADNERRSNANIDMICASTEMLAQQLDKLSELQNKGVHGELLRSEARRCLIRTFLILDDIVSLRDRPLSVKIYPDFSIFKDFKDG